MQLSSVIGKPILSPSGEAFGYVTNARLARGYGKISCYVCSDAEEEEFFLPARAVRSLGDAIIAGRARLKEPSGINSPIGLAAYSYRGEALGDVCDLLLAEGAEGVLVLEKDGVRITVPTANCVVGETLIVYPDRKARAASPTRRKKAPAPRAAADAPMPERNAAESTAPDAPPATEEAQDGDTDAPAPAPAAREAVPAIDLNRTNLLGRQVKRSVYDRQGNLIAMAGERVTPAVLSRARRSNRLLELTVKTLTNY